MDTDISECMSRYTGNVDNLGAISENMGGGDLDRKVADR